MKGKGQKTLLLVDDEAIIAMAEKLALEKYGYQVVLAHSGEEAIAAVQRDPNIDLILMDINMGDGMDGTEAAALILKERDIPVVFLSSHMEPEVVAKTEKITSYGYVVKDSSITVLDASIKMAFKLFDAKVSEKRKEEELRQSEEILRYIVKYDPNAIAVYDRGLHYIAVSDRYLKDYCVREADIIGRHHYDVFPEMPQKWRDVHRRCLAGAVEGSDDDFFERPDGSITYNRWECRPWRTVAGDIGGIITYTEVTTERKQAELKLAQSLDLLTKLARLVPGVIYQYRLDPDGRSAFPYASPGMNDIYEVTPEEVREDATPVFGRLHPDDYDMVAGAIQASALTLNTFYCEFRVNLPRQGLRWRWSQAHPERLADGGTLWHGIISDITERKLAEEALRKSEEQFRTLGTMAPIGIYLTDTRGGCRYANPHWCKMAGLTLEEALGDGWMRGIHPDDREAVFAAWQKTVESEGRWGLEYRFQTREGKITWVQGLAAAQRDAQDVIAGYVGVNIDITQRKLAEEALKASEARDQALLRTIPDMLFRVDRRGIFLDYRADARDLYDQSGTSFIGKSCREVLPPDLADLIDARIRLALESGALQTFTYQLAVPGKGLRDYEARLIASGAGEATAIVRDVTESHRAQRALREAEERWRDILFSMADWVWEVDANGVYTYSSEKGEDFLGTSRGNIIGKTPFDFMPPEEAKRVGAIFAGIVARKGVVKDLENWNVGRNGEAICLLTNGVPILDEAGNLKGYRGVDQDITARKQAEKTIEDSLRFRQVLLDAVPMPIFYKDANLAYLGGNQAFERFIGLPRERFIGKTVFDISPADLAETYDRADRELLAGKGSQTYESVVANADGTRREVIFNKAIFTDGEGRVAGLIGVILDISERVRMEAERRALQEISQGMLKKGSLQDFLGLVHRSISAVVHAENFFVALYNKETSMFEEAYSLDQYDASFPPSRLEKSLSKHVFRTGRPLLVDEGVFAELTATGEVELVGTPSPSWIGAPLMAGGKAIGVMVAQDYAMKDRYTASDLDLFAAIANQVALAVERKQAEEEIQRQLRDKEMLLKEVHHRSKNNFAAIAGLLSMHKQASASPEAVAALQDAIGRVDSLRLLYEKLLQGGDYRDASVKNYVESLAASVVALFPDQAKIALEQRVDDFQLDPKRLFPLGIIINELLTNIMKYAFAGKKSGRIRLSLAKEENRVTLVLQDNGIGLAEGFDAAKSQGFGLTLVKMLSQQLGGSFAIEKHRGTRCTVTFAI